LSTTGLAAGTYVATLTDTVADCRRNVTLSLQAPPAALLVDVRVEAPTTCEGADGAITMQVTGGTDVVVSGDLNALTTTGLAAGAYAVTLLDQNTNCSLDTTIVVPTAPVPFMLAADVVPVGTCDAPDGSIQLTLTGGSGNFTFSGQLTAALTTGLPEGTYAVTVLDAVSGCSLDTSFYVAGCVVPCAVVATSTPTLPTTCDATDGSLLVTATGGTAPYTYTLGGTANQTGAFGGLGAGTYSVIVTDAAGCGTTVETSIVPFGAPVLTLLDVTQPTGCGVPNGRIELMADGGAAPYAYALNGGTFGADPVFDALAAGEYTVRVRDDNGCLTQLSFTLFNEDVPQLALVERVDPNACSGTDGRIAVSVTGGTGAVSYALNGGTFGPDSVFRNLAAGTYQIVARDAAGCTDTLAGVVIEEQNRLDLQLVSSTAPTCSGETNGSLTVAVSGGAGLYLYQLNGGTPQSTPTFTGLAAGDYEVIVTDGGTCADTLMVTLDGPAPLTLATANSTTTECGAATGTLTVTTTGGTPGYTYSLNGGAFGTDSTFGGLAAGFYAVTVRDAAGCEATLDAVEITSPGGFNVVTDVTSPTACDTEDGAVMFRISGVSADRIRVAGDLTALSNAGLAPGVYRVTLTDTVTHCTLTATATLQAPAARFLVSIDTRDPQLCGGTDGSIILTVTDSSNMQVSGDLSTLTTTGLAAGTYAVTLTDLANGCSIDTVITLHDGRAPFTLRAEVRPISDCANPDGAINLFVIGGSGAFTFTGDLTSASTGSLAEGVYTVTITDAVSGCTLDTSFTLGGCSIPCALAPSA
ncbi:MAG: SprB repeat-containing protein, partial [Catalinimonas sp.]